ncbi:MAG: transposase [Rhodobacteraceae bacterium]|nr:transposase [Paracoccaceae bacterium]
MANYFRPRISGATVFFTVELAERGSTLLVDEVGRMRTAVREVMRARPFWIDAWVVLPDHQHCIWTLPEGDADYSARWGAIKHRFSRGLPPGRLRASHKMRREKGIWQRRFWEHHIRNNAELEATISYCRENPVKHGLVEQAQDWPFSSIHRDLP